MDIIRPVYAEVLISDPNVNSVARFAKISSFTNLLVPLMMVGGGLVALIMLLLGAYRYITSEGNPEKISKAQNVILYAIIGLFLIVLAFVFTKVIGTIFNVKIPL